MSDGIEKMEPEQSNRLQLVEARTYHIDGKVAAIESQLGQQGTQLNRIEHHLMNKPAPSYGVWVGIGITILFGCITGLYGLANYLGLQLDPIVAATAKNGASIEQLEVFKAETHYEMGVGRTQRKSIDEAMKNSYRLYYDLEHRVDRLDAEGRAIETWGNWHDRLEEDRRMHVRPHETN